MNYSEMRDDPVSFALAVLEDPLNWPELDCQRERLTEAVRMFMLASDEVRADLGEHDSDKRVILTEVVEGNTGMLLTLYDLIVANDFDDDDLTALRALAIGDTHAFGGGAAALSVFQRVK